LLEDLRRQAGEGTREVSGLLTNSVDRLDESEALLGHLVDEGFELKPSEALAFVSRQAAIDPMDRAGGGQVSDDTGVHHCSDGLDLPRSFNNPVCVRAGLGIASHRDHEVEDESEAPGGIEWFEATSGALIVRVFL
jgi:hypothetical protein